MPKRRQATSSAKSKPHPKKAAAAPKNAKKAVIPVVTAAMNVMEVIALHSGAADILGMYGLHCFHCAFNTLDSIEAGARSHGLVDEDIENLVDDLNELLASEPSKPRTIILTRAAADALSAIQSQEEKEGGVLRVQTDASGSFCMEFEKSSQPDDLVIVHPDVPSLMLVVSPAALFRIGGATIDFLDGRFKLNLPATSAACGCDGGTCTCGKHDAA